ncbi:MAG: GWxTD domain-containing protein [Bacteroidetes bacterium]|nr:MAG: GWxTD domain-containing protein [Bacteroidota bacterium]
MKIGFFFFTFLLNQYVFAQNIDFSLSSKNINFVKEQDTLFFQGADKMIYVYRIKDRFLPAAPPMIIKDKRVEAELRADSLFAIPTKKSFKLSQQNLYFAQADTTSNVGFGFRLTSKDFPKVRKLDQVIEPLVYIASEEELFQIYRDGSKKSGLDQFWLRIGLSQEYSRQIIRAFYKRVEYANQNFTTYKEGWKTDMGMIYIVFGEPKRINKSNDSEEWIYEQSVSKRFDIGFTFVKKNNQFCKNHYELQRDVRYNNVWNEGVDKWRKGEIKN